MSINFFNNIGKYRAVITPGAEGCERVILNGTQRIAVIKDLKKEDGNYDIKETERVISVIVNALNSHAK